MGPINQPAMQCSATVQPAEQLAPHCCCWHAGTVCPALSARLSPLHVSATNISNGTVGGRACWGPTSQAGSSSAGLQPAEQLAPHCCCWHAGTVCPALPARPSPLHQPATSILIEWASGRACWGPTSQAGSSSAGLQPAEQLAPHCCCCCWHAGTVCPALPAHL